MKLNSRFYKQLLWLILVIEIFGSILFTTILKEYYLPVFPFLVLFFAVMTVSFHTILMRSLKKAPKSFSYVFMGLSGGKLLLILLLVVVYLILRRETVIPFLAGTFLLYLVFTLFEVKTLLQLVQGKE
jgi:hypothetical protein